MLHELRKRVFATSKAYRLDAAVVDWVPRFMHVVDMAGSRVAYGENYTNRYCETLERGTVAPSQGLTAFPSVAMIKMRGGAVW
jgi:hypothetical protein